MRKKFFLAIIISSISLSFYAQNLQKAFELINTQPQKAQKIFKKYINKKKDLPAAQYGITIIAFNKNHSIPNLPKYYHNLLIIKELLKKSNTNKINEYKNYGLTIHNIDTLLNWIINTETRQIINFKNIERVDYFARVYPDAKQIPYLKHFKDSLLFDQTIKQNTLDAYKNFLKKYPESEYKKIAQQKRDSIWKRKYHKAYMHIELADINNFQKENPDYPFYDDSTLIITTWAIQANDLQLQKGFIKEYAADYGKLIKKTAPSELAYQLLLTLISPDLEQFNIRNALDTIKKYRYYFKNYSKIDSLVKLIKNPQKLQSKPLSPNINSPAYEYIPVVTADQKTIYFCGRNRKDNYEPENEDIFVSYFKNGQWTKPFIVRDLSTPYRNEAPMSISADGNTMLIFVNGDIFITHKTYSGWTNPIPIKQINTKDSWEADAFLTADGNAIIFSSDRQGNIGTYHPINNKFHSDFLGNLDLYVIVKQKDNTWSKPINLGPVINTPFAERSPFLHPDMKTLYFASDGHPGLGKLDIFKSTRLSDTSWTQWSEPVNLGYGINSPKKEYGYKISTDGTKAFFSKFLDNQADIYKISLPPKAKPNKVVIIYGYVTDDKNKPLNANIIWENLTKNITLGKLSTEPKTGYYTLTLPLGVNYGLIVSKQTYYPASANIDLTKNVDTLKIRKDFHLIPTDLIFKGDTSVPLNNVFFDFDKSTIKKTSYAELDRLAEFIKKHPNLNFEISGHTDNTGTEQYNMQLSLKRAIAVKNYLISKGCNPNKLKARGYGDKKPLVPNTSEDNKNKNRRVEFKIIY